MPHFFISYNGADRSWAEWIAWQLEGAGYVVVIQAWDFRPGAHFVLEMQKATRAERTLIVLSPDFLQASYTQSEWAAAFVQDPTGTQRKLLPVRVRECEPEGLLQDLVYIDLVGLAEPDARQALLAGIEKRGKPDTEPAFPGKVAHTATAQPAFPPRVSIPPSGPLKLTKDQRKQLFEILADAFGLTDLKQMLDFDLDRRLDAITSERGNLRTIVFDVIRASEREGWTRTLVQAVRDARPERADIQAFTGELLGF